MSETTMRFITNTDENNLTEVLKEEIPYSNTVAIAVAFMTDYGLSAIGDSLLQVVRKGGIVTLITGFYQAVTDPKALEKLLVLKENFPNRVSVGVSKEQQFHQKLYYMQNRDEETTAFVIGSSNLTSGGLRSGGELDLFVKVSNDNQLAQDVYQIYASEIGRCVSLTGDLIDRYEQNRKELHRLSQMQSNDTAILNDVLGTDSFHRDCETGTKNPFEEQRRAVQRAYNKTQYKAQKEWAKKRGIH